MKYEFASEAWLSAVHGIMAYAAAHAGGSADFRISICEVYLDVPDDRGGKDGRLAWSCVSEGGRVAFELRERDDVDLKITVDFAVARQIARLDGSDPASAADLARRAEAGRREGKIVVISRRPEAPNGFAPSIHDLLARMTA